MTSADRPQAASFQHAFSASAGEGNTIDRALKAIREHLGMPVAYLSEFVGNESVFRNVDAPGMDELIKVGDSRSLDDVYCRHILEGRLPKLIPDTAREPKAAQMPITRDVPIGSHVSIPILLEDGTPYGMFCCLSPEPNDSLNERDLQVMEMFASIAAEQVRREEAVGREQKERTDRIQSMLEEQRFAIAYQPIVHLQSRRPVGYEALCRFNAEPARTPDIWFNEAGQVGLGAELETRAIEVALSALSRLAPDQYLSVNASPATIHHDGFQRVMRSVDLSRVMLEITEHAMVTDYESFVSAIEPLRAQGMCLAIDDAGAGHSSLRHTLQLNPDYLKLDMSLTRNVHEDLSRRALVSALVYYARETGAQIIAEGIENEEELSVLKLLGVQRGQGYHLGRPAIDHLQGQEPLSKTGS